MKRRLGVLAASAAGRVPCVQAAALVWSRVLLQVATVAPAPRENPWRGHVA